MFKGAFQRRSCPYSSEKPQQASQFQCLGSPLRVKASLIFCLFVLGSLSAQSAERVPSVPGVTTRELAAWLTGGVSCNRLTQIVKERGLASLPTNHELRALESVGAGPELIKIVQSGNVLSARIGRGIPDG